MNRQKTSVLSMLAILYVATLGYKLQAMEFTKNIAQGIYSTYCYASEGYRIMSTPLCTIPKTPVLPQMDVTPARILVGGYITKNTYDKLTGKTGSFGKRWFAIGGLMYYIYHLNKYEHDKTRKHVSNAHEGTCAHISQEHKVTREGVKSVKQKMLVLATTTHILTCASHLATHKNIKAAEDRMKESFLKAAYDIKSNVLQAINKAAQENQGFTKQELDKLYQNIKTDIDQRIQAIQKSQQAITTELLAKQKKEILDQVHIFINNAFQEIKDRLEKLEQGQARNEQKLTEMQEKLIALTRTVEQAVEKSALDNQQTHANQQEIIKLLQQQIIRK